MGAVLDLRSLSLADLKTIRANLPGIIEEKEASAQTEFLQTMRDQAEAAGIDFDALLKVQSGRKNSKSTVKKTVAPKYRHPADHNLTWAGRGVRPGWLNEYESQGGTLDECLISNQT